MGSLDWPSVDQTKSCRALRVSAAMLPGHSAPPETPYQRKYSSSAAAVNSPISSPSVARKLIKSSSAPSPASRSSTLRLTFGIFDAGRRRSLPTRLSTTAATTTTTGIANRLDFAGISAATRSSQQQQRRSILKNVGDAAAAVGVVEQRNATPKRVSFEEGVLWFHFDGVDDEHLRLESRPLLAAGGSSGDVVYPSRRQWYRSPTSAVSFVFGSPRPDRRGRLSAVEKPSSTGDRRPLRRTASLMDTCGSNPRDVGADTVVSRSSASDGAGHLLFQTDVRFVVVDDESSGTSTLKFAVPVGLDVDPADVVVRSDSGGDSVRIEARRRRSAVSSSGVEPAQTVGYSLPVFVDPFQITARFDSTSGTLFVEAPVVGQKTFV